MGRFVNGDAIIGETGTLLSHNMFSYCINNPVMLDDPSGFMPGVNSMIAPDGGANSSGGTGFGELIGLVIEGAGKLVSAAILGVTVAINSHISRAQIVDNSTTITSEKDIDMTKRKSGMFYPARFDKFINTLVIDFTTPLTAVEAATRVKNLQDVYTFDGWAAQNLGKNTGGPIMDRAHYHRYDGGIAKPGLYWDHFHGTFKNYDMYGKPCYVHIFFGLPNPR